MHSGVTWASLLSSAALTGVTLLTMALRYPHMRPSQRLFAFGFLAYVVTSAAITTWTIATGRDVLWWRAPALLIGNIWLIGAVFALWLEWRKDRSDGDV